ncbi:MAG: xylulokinase [Gammaproteobacteria bacterium]|nr:xylulokinase [Gammaproteobacteria bacterium]
MYLGIDLGTSSVKILLLNAQHDIVAQNSQSLNISRPKPLWSEQDPHEWWDATCTAIKTIAREHSASLKQVKAIGLSGQQHGAVLLDKTGRILRPAILWNDGRSGSEAEQLMQRVPNYAHIVGSVIMAGFTAPKLMWLEKHEPEIYQQVAMVLLPKDYLRYRLTGVYASDMSDASGTMWLNVAERRWSNTMLAASDMKLTQMPEVFEGSDVTATVTQQIASEWGIPVTTVVAAGAGDNAATAISVGVVANGECLLSLGTSGTYFIAADKFHPNVAGAVHTFCHCLPKLWHQMNCHLTAASAMTWWADVSHTDLETLVNEAEQSKTHDPQLLFLPYLSGERTPINDPHARAVFFGMTHETQRPQLTQAVLEGVALNFAEGQDCILQSGMQIKKIAVVGGGARSLYWGKILAATLNQPLTYYANREIGGALGAARLAYLAVNGVASLSDFPCLPIEQIIEPNTQWVDKYAKKKERFKKLYQAIKSEFINQE